MTILLRLVFILTTTLTLPILIIRAQPRHDTALADFLVPGMDCLPPCFLGIRPGMTTVDEALVILRSHEWVNEARLQANGQGYGQIRWDWSGLQTDLIDDSFEGRITFYWEEDDPVYDSPGKVRVESLLLHTHIRMYEAQAWFGAPDSGTADFVRYDDNLLQYSAAYHQPAASVRLSAIVPCPATWMSYWNARVDMMLTIGHGSSQYLEPPELLGMC